MLFYNCFLVVFLAVSIKAEQEDLNSHRSSDLTASRLKEVQEQLVQLSDQLNTLNSQMATLMASVANDQERSCTRNPAITDCSEVKDQRSGIYPLKVCSDPPYNVYCNQTFEDGSWMVIYNRFDGPDHTFNQTWEAYRRGFGQPDGEHFIGLERLHSLTYGRSYEVAFILNRDGQEHVGIYDRFEIDNGRDHFPIRVIGSGRGGLRLFPETTELRRFQTYDRNNLHPLARVTMIEEECGFWFVDMPHGHDSPGFQRFCANLRQLKVMIRKRPNAS